MDVFLMIRRKKTTMFLDAKENTKVADLKRMIEGITKKPPPEQRLYNKEDVSQVMENQYSLVDYGITIDYAPAQNPAKIGLAYSEEGIFEELEIVPYSSPPELPPVMKPEKDATKNDKNNGGSGDDPGSSADSSRPGSSATISRPGSSAGNSASGTNSAGTSA